MDGNTSESSAELTPTVVKTQVSEEDIEKARAVLSLTIEETDVKRGDGSDLVWMLALYKTATLQAYLAFEENNEDISAYVDAMNFIHDEIVKEYDNV